jgi:hypothetical protein
MTQFVRPELLHHPDQWAYLDGNIDAVKNHPAMYAYYVTDEPGAAEFPALGQLVEYIRKRDPKHLVIVKS